MTFLTGLGGAAAGYNDARKQEEETKLKNIQLLVEMLKANWKPAERPTEITQTASDFMGGPLKVGQLPITRPGLGGISLGSQELAPNTLPQKPGLAGIGLGTQGQLPNTSTQRPRLELPTVGELPVGTVTLPEPIGGEKYWMPPEDKNTKTLDLYKDKLLIKATMDDAKSNIKGWTDDKVIIELTGVQAKKDNAKYYNPDADTTNYDELILLLKKEIDRRGLGGSGITPKDYGPAGDKYKEGEVIMNKKTKEKFKVVNGRIQEYK